MGLPERMLRQRIKGRSPYISVHRTSEVGENSGFGGKTVYNPCRANAKCSNQCFDQAARLNASHVASLARSKAARVSVKAAISEDHDWVPAWFNFSSFFSASTASAFIRFKAASISPRRSEANFLASLPSLSAASRHAFNWASA